MNMGFGDIIPLCPENTFGGKSTAANPKWTHVSAADESTWFRGDPTLPRLLPHSQVHHLQNHRDAEHGGRRGSVKELLQGDYYNLRENGFSGIAYGEKPPDASVDGSCFQPGVAGEMTGMQERAFFKHQAHDELNRTYVSRVVKGDFMYGDMKKRPRLNVTNKIALNRMAASKPSSRSQSTLAKRTGATPTSPPGDWRHPQRREAERIANATGELFDKKAHYDVLDFLTKTSQGNRESLESLFGSMLGPTDLRPDAALGAAAHDTRPDAEIASVHSPFDSAARPGTAAVMERSERDLQRSVANQLHKTKVPDARILTPKFGVSNLHKQRLMGHRSDCTGKIGHVTSFDERIRDLRKALRDHVYLKVKDKKEGWRWFDPDALGYIDVHCLYCIVQEFMIDATMEECTALHSMLDLDGDGIIGFEDLNNALFDTALSERDFFRVTDKPCSDVANERIIFQGYQDADGKLGDTVQSDWARLSRVGDDSDNIGANLHRQADAARPATAQSNYDARPATAATEIHEFTKPAPLSRPATGSRPATSMGMQQSLSKRYNQIWSDAARIAALTGGQDSVDDIRKVLERVRPLTADQKSAPGGSWHDRHPDKVQGAPKVGGNSNGRDAGAEMKKSGKLPRNITAEQARQLMANSKAAPSHAVTAHAANSPIPAAIFGGPRGRPSRIRPHQFHTVFGKSAEDFVAPTTEMQAAGSTNLNGADKSGRQVRSRDEARKPKLEPAHTSSFFLTASKSTAHAGDGDVKKAYVGAERVRGARTQSLTIDTPTV